MPYGSARDLPVFREMEQQLKTMRLLGLLLPKKQRALLKDLPVQIDRLTSTVDAFYDLLSPRNWVFHGSLNLEEMAALVARHAGDIEAAEQALLGWYQEDGRLRRLVMQLNRHEGLRARMNLLKLSVEDHDAGRYYAVVQVLISVMDGFVNDLNPASRKGLHARGADEMDAWNSVVSHHLGLTSAHKTFTKNVKARCEEPVHELYRNGIVHGMLTNYNNAIVATKAWNRLFAVADWADALEAEKAEAAKPPASTLRDSLELMRTTADTRAAIRAFTPRTMGADDEDLPTHPAFEATTRFLTAWQQGNYGAMAGQITDSLGGVRPVDVRQDYQDHSLQGFEVLSLEHSAVAGCTVTVQLRIDDQAFRPELRWVREGPDGHSAAPNESGEWRLKLWGFVLMARNTNP